MATGSSSGRADVACAELVIASNRLPFTLVETSGALRQALRALVTGLASSLPVEAARPAGGSA